MIPVPDIEDARASIWLSVGRWIGAVLLSAAYLAAALVVVALVALVVVLLGLSLVILIKNLWSLL